MPAAQPQLCGIGTFGIAKEAFKTAVHAERKLLFMRSAFPATNRRFAALLETELMIVKAWRDVAKAAYLHGDAEEAALAIGNAERTLERMKESESNAIAKRLIDDYRSMTKPSWNGAFECRRSKTCVRFAEFSFKMEIIAKKRPARRFGVKARPRTGEAALSVQVMKYKSFMEERFPFKFHFGNHPKTKQPVHMHDYVQLIYVMRGSCGHFYCDRDLVISKGDLFMIPPWVEHSVNNDGHDADIVMIDFLPVLVNDKLAGFTQTVMEWMNAGSHGKASEEDSQEGQPVGESPSKGQSAGEASFEARSVGGNPSKVKVSGKAPYKDQPAGEASSEGQPANLRGTWLHFPPEKQLLVEQLLLDIADELKHKDKGYEFSIQLNLVKLLQLMDRELGKQERNSREGRGSRLKQTHFDRVIKYIAENYMKDITLEQGAELANMAPAYFSHQFKRTTGTAFIERLHETRIERAKELIIDDRLSMTDICYEVGFHHLSHFIRTFKKKTGLTPTAYKKSLSYEPDPETTPFC